MHHSPRRSQRPVFLPVLGSLLLGLALSGCNQTRPTDELAQAQAGLSPEGPAETTVATPSPTTESAETPDLWSRLRGELRMDKVYLNPDEDARVEHQLRGLLKNPHHLPRISSRAEPFLHLIVEEVQKRGMPMELALLPAIESGFQPFAHSSGKASGLWQFIPSTGRMFGLKQNWWYDGRRDVLAATPAALDYLAQLNKQFDGDWLLALASYNAGGGTVRRAIRRNLREGKPTDFWHLQLPRETMNYVPRLLAVSRMVAEPEKYNITLHSIADEPRLVSIDIGSQIDLARAAMLADMELQDLHILNPGFNRWTTGPDGPHQLLIPQQQAGLFRDQLEKLPANSRVEWQRHTVRKGDTLGALARRFHTTTTTLRQLNNMSGSNIYQGQALMVPVASTATDPLALNTAQTLIRQQSPGIHRKPKSHKVKSGDTLWELGRRYGVSTRQLTAWNKLRKGAVLKIGQKLRVSDHNGRQGSFIKTSRSGKPARTIEYTVRKGDSLSRIAHRHQVSVTKLRLWNKGKLGKYLKPGQKLTVHTGSARSAGQV